MTINGWRVVGIILFIVIFILSIYTVAKMSYAVGYEDGKDGLISLIKISEQTQGKISNFEISKNPEMIKRIVYFILNPNERGFKKE